MGSAFEHEVDASLVTPARKNRTGFKVESLPNEDGLSSCLEMDVKGGQNFVQLLCEPLQLRPSSTIFFVFNLLSAESHEPSP